MEEVREVCVARGENEKMQGKCAATEKSGSNCGGETHET